MKSWYYLQIFNHQICCMNRLSILNLLIIRIGITHARYHFNPFIKIYSSQPNHMLLTFFNVIFPKDKQGCYFFLTCVYFYFPSASFSQRPVNSHGYHTISQLSPINRTINFFIFVNTRVHLFLKISSIKSVKITCTRASIFLFFNDMRFIDFRIELVSMPYAKQW